MVFLTLLLYGLSKLAGFWGMNLSQFRRTDTALVSTDRAHRDLQLETHPTTMASR